MWVCDVKRWTLFFISHAVSAFLQFTHSLAPDSRWLWSLTWSTELINVNDHFTCCCLRCCFLSFSRLSLRFNTSILLITFLLFVCQILSHNLDCYVSFDSFIFCFIFVSKSGLFCKIVGEKHILNDYKNTILNILSYCLYLSFNS